MVSTAMRARMRVRLRAGVSDGEHRYKGEDEGEVDDECE